MEDRILHSRICEHLGPVRRLHAVLEENSTRSTPPAPHHGLHLCYRCAFDHRARGTPHGFLCEWRHHLAHRVRYIGAALDILHGNGADKSQAKRFQGASTIHDPELCVNAFRADVATLEICHYQFLRTTTDGRLSFSGVAGLGAEYNNSGVSHPL